jgi:hypothetical protein
MGTVEALVVRMASENPRWKYTRIQGALANRGHKVARGTVANILKREGIEPAPTRGSRTPWSVFLKAHWRSLVAGDFLTVEVGKLRGLMTYYVLSFIELPTRAVRIAGITTNPAEGWMLQIARSACELDDGALPEGRKLLIDRDAKYSGDWRAFLKEQGAEVLRLPPKSPNLNVGGEGGVRRVDVVMAAGSWSIQLAGSMATNEIDETIESRARQRSSARHEARAHRRGLGAGL